MRRFTNSQGVIAFFHHIGNFIPYMMKMLKITILFLVFHRSLG